METCCWLNWYRYMPGSNAKRRRQRKNDRKERVRVEVYNRRLEKWKKREPAKWRLIAHLRWTWEKPRHPLERR